jgi:hypothetical protein
MEFSPTGWLAYYKPTTPNGTVLRPVEAWNSEGDALVVDEARGKLVRASNIADFVRLARCSRVVAAVTAQPGWALRLWEDDHDDASVFSLPITAWLVDESGNLTPVTGGNDSYLGVAATTQRSEIMFPDVNQKP